MWSRSLDSLVSTGYPNNVYPNFVYTVWLSRCSYIWEQQKAPKHHAFFLYTYNYIVVAKQYLSIRFDIQYSILYIIQVRHVTCTGGLLSHVAPWVKTEDGLKWVKPLVVVMESTLPQRLDGFANINIPACLIQYHYYTFFSLVVVRNLLTNYLVIVWWCVALTMSSSEC